MSIKAHATAYVFTNHSVHEPLRVDVTGELPADRRILSARFLPNPERSIALGLEFSSGGLERVPALAYAD